MTSAIRIADAVPRASAQVSGRVVAVRVEPFDAPSIRAHFLAHGIDIGSEGQRYGAEGEGPSFYVSDPEGNVVELKGPPNRGEAAANE